MARPVEPDAAQGDRGGAARSARTRLRRRRRCRFQLARGDHRPAAAQDRRRPDRDRTRARLPPDRAPMMRMMPRSLFGRLLATAGAALLVALVFAGFAIGHVLERFVIHGLDDRLDAQIAVVARAVRPDGTLDRVRMVDVPPFDVPGSGWAWELRAPGGTLRS